MSRRTFLRDSATVVAGTALGSCAITAVSAENTRGANERVNIALVGCGDRGNFVARGMIEKGASITFLCDLQPDRLEKSRQFISEVQKAKPRLVKDMREVFGSKDVDAVVIATPDHWHAPATVLACQAGKSV